MYVVCVTIHVKPEFAEQFLEAILDNARNTRKEPGNLRFDVVRGVEETNRFFLYEVYREKADFLRHQITEHYERWRNAANPWMAEPRVGLHHVPVFYGDGVTGDGDTR